MTHDQLVKKEARDIRPNTGQSKSRQSCRPPSSAAFNLDGRVMDVPFRLGQHQQIQERLWASAMCLTEETSPFEELQTIDLEDIRYSYDFKMEKQILLVR